MKRDCSASYYIDDDLKIVVLIDESRSYDSQKVFTNNGPEDHIPDEDALKALKENYPAPKQRKMVLTFRDDEDIPYLSGIDSNRKDVSLHAILKD